MSSGCSAQNPAAAPYVMGNLFQYAQARYMYEFGQFWEPMLAAATAAPVRAAAAARTGCRPGLMPIPG